MKRTAVIIPTIVSLMTVAIAPKASAEPQIYPTTDGFEMNIGDCYAHFDNSGNLLQGGSMCDDIQLYEARQAAHDYVLQQQSASSQPEIYPNANGFELNIGNCYARFDTHGNLVQGGSLCDDIELYEAQQAARDYVSQQRESSNQPQIHPTASGFELNIGNCYARFDFNGNLIQGGSMCDDIQLYEARQAAMDYVSR
ncbi:MAG: hypothetical protein VKL39_16380 [Leptolyngbyaceae bacterium]|nr:hypothetical protein [Leptolyngbyaceae bacterium]